MGFYKRTTKTGAVWYVQFFANGKRIRGAVGPSKREAELVVRKRKAAIEEGKFFGVRKETTVTFNALCTRYLAEYAALHKKPSSYQRNIRSTKVLQAFFGAETLLIYIQPEDVHQFLVRRKELNRPPYTSTASWHSSPIFLHGQAS